MKINEKLRLFLITTGYENNISKIKYLSGKIKKDAAGFELFT